MNSIEGLRGLIPYSFDIQGKQSNVKPSEVYDFGRNTSNLCLPISNSTSHPSSYDTQVEEGIAAVSRMHLQQYK